MYTGHELARRMDIVQCNGPCGLVVGLGTRVTSVLLREYTVRMETHTRLHLESYIALTLDRSYRFETSILIPLRLAVDA